MNVKNARSARLVTALSTGMTISFLRSACLTVPIWSILALIYSATSPVWVIFPALFSGHSSIHTFWRTKSAVSKSYLVRSGFIFLTTIFAFFCYVYFWFSFLYFWLTCSKFRTTLIRTKSRLAISPSYKLFAAPVTNKDGFLRWVFWRPSEFKSAFFRTKASRFKVSVERTATNFTGFNMRWINATSIITLSIAIFLTLIACPKSFITVYTGLL